MRADDVGAGGLYLLLHTHPMTEMVYMALNQLLLGKVRRHGRPRVAWCALCALPVVWLT